MTRVIGMIAGAGVFLSVCLQAHPPRLAAQGRGGFGGVRVEQKVVAQFDKDGDKRLNAEERRAARVWLNTQGFAGRRGGRGGFFAPPQPGPRLTPADATAHATTPLYDLATLRTLFFQFEEDDWERELADFYNTDVEVPATVTVDGKVYQDVGVRFRGNSSYSMVPEGLKHSLNVSFDFVHKAQAPGGYHTLHLLNANADPTFTRIMLYSEIGRAYVPMPKANAMRVAINGEHRGIYVNTQPFNKDFLREWFGKDDTDGPRWKVAGSPGSRSGGLSYLGDNVASYKASFELKTKEDPKAWADLIALTRVLDETPPAQLEAALAPILDVDGVLKFLALDIAFVNGDGYWTRGSDYSIYEDATHRFHIVPHDFNEGFGAEEGGRGGFGFGGGGAQLDPLVGLNDTSKPLRSRLLAVPALRARYLAAVRDIAERGLDWKTLGPLVAKYQALIGPSVLADTRKLYSNAAFQTGVGEAGAGENTVRGFIETRRAYLLKYTAPSR